MATGVVGLGVVRAGGVPGFVVPLPFWPVPVLPLPVLTGGLALAGGVAVDDGGDGVALVLGLAGEGAGVAEPFVGTSTFGSVPVLVPPGVVGVPGVVCGGAVVAAGGGIVAGGAWATWAVEVAGGAAGSSRSAA